MLSERSIPPTTDAYGQLVSVSLPCDGVTLAHLLKQGLGQARFYWESSRDDVALAGVGTALDIVAWGTDRFSTIQEHLKALFQDALIESDEPLASPRVFGGFAFRDDFMPDNTWADFAPAHFVLPHYQLVRVHDKTYLTINAQVSDGEDAREIVDGLREALLAKISQLQQTPADVSVTPAHPMEVTYPMSHEVWTQMIDKATARMKQGELKKAVLSRVAEIRFVERVDVDSALAYLSGAYPQTYRFLFEARPHVAFYGATPEILAEVNGSTLKTMALAGSIRRGKTAEEDETLREQLLADPKERFEHQLVVDSLQQRLTSLTTQLNIGATSVLTLSNIQHLYTPFDGQLADSQGILPVIASLHPTPALGGDPREVAMQLISDYEPVPRGWFGAPIGWIDSTLNGQFGVAIRSAIAQEKRVWLYAGAGIVADSQAQKEWDETALKFKPMLNALGVDLQLR